MAAAFYLQATDVSAGRLTTAPQRAAATENAPTFAPNEARPSERLGSADEIATLHAINLALFSVGDGGAYVWRRGNGAINGVVRPTTSFKTKTGEVCRHIVVKLNSGLYSRRTEGIACLSREGVWTLGS